MVSAGPLAVHVHSPNLAPRRVVCESTSNGHYATTFFQDRGLAEMYVQVSPAYPQQDRRNRHLKSPWYRRRSRGRGFAIYVELRVDIRVRVSRNPGLKQSAQVAQGS